MPCRKSFKVLGRETRENTMQSLVDDPAVALDALA